HDSQKPQNKIQGTWSAAVNGVGIGLDIRNGSMALAMDDGVNCVSVGGRYHFVSDNTMSVSLDQASGAPFQSGLLTVVSVDSTTLVLRDEAGEYIRFRRV